MTSFDRILTLHVVVCEFEIALVEMGADRINPEDTVEYGVGINCVCVLLARSREQWTIAAEAIRGRSGPGRSQ